jgi:uncharacterized protein
MRNATLALCCFLIAGPVLAQQPAAHPSSAAPSASSASEPQTPPPPAHPLTDEQAKQMLEMTGANDIKKQLTQGMTNYFRQSMPFIPKDVMDDLDQSLDKLDMQTPIIAVYKQHISQDDADAIIAFYKTPAGKDMIEVMPGIMRQSQQLGLQMGRQTAQEVINRHRPEIEAAAKQYQQEHEPKAPSLNTPGTQQSTPPASTPAKPATTTPPSK